MVIERGQIIWCGLDPVQGHEQGAPRPVVIVSSDSYDASRSPLTAIVPLTRATAKNPIHLSFPPEQTGLDSVSTSLVDHAHFIGRGRLRGAAIGKLHPPAMALLGRNLSRVFGRPT